MAYIIKDIAKLENHLKTKVKQARKKYKHFNKVIKYSFKYDYFMDIVGNLAYTEVTEITEGNRCIKFSSFLHKTSEFKFKDFDNLEDYIETLIGESLEDEIYEEIKEMKEDLVYYFMLKEIKKSKYKLNKRKKGIFNHSIIIETIIDDLFEDIQDLDSLREIKKIAKDILEYTVK